MKTEPTLSKRITALGLAIAELEHLYKRHAETETARIRAVMDARQTPKSKKFILGATTLKNETYPASASVNGDRMMVAQFFGEDCEKRAQEYVDLLNGRDDA